MMRRLPFILLMGLGLILARPLPVFCAADDWPRAMELMNAGQSVAALPYLERLVSAHPGDKNYRFKLVLALFRLGRDFRAKWHLDQVRGAKLTAKEARVVEHYLNQIEARRVWSGYFGFALKPESNAGRQTGDSHINVGGLNFVLTPASRAKPGTSVIAHGGLSYSPRITDRLKGVFGLNAYLRYNNDISLRDYQVMARSGLEYLPTARSRIAGGTLLAYRWIAEKPYFYSGGVWAEYSTPVGMRVRLDLGAEVGRTQYEIALPASRQQTDNRRGPEPIFGVKRRDRNTSLDLTVYHRDFRIGNFAPELVLGIERNRSNIPLADYRNRYLSIGLTRNF